VAFLLFRECEWCIDRASVQVARVSTVRPSSHCSQHKINQLRLALRSHCEERYACADPKTCGLYPKPYVSVQCGCSVPNPGIYQMPLWVLFPKKAQVTNLIVPVCASASHVAYATIRMEPQFMMLGEAAGVVAALTVKAGGAVPIQDVDQDAVATLLRAEGAILGPTETPAVYGCQTGTTFQRCMLDPHGSGHHSSNSTCNGQCPGFQPRQWLALRAHFYPPSSSGATTLKSHMMATVIKKSEALSQTLPRSAIQPVGVPGENISITLWLAESVVEFDSEYYLITCASNNCSATP
jgi:hypothetical protein